MFSAILIKGLVCGVIGGILAMIVHAFKSGREELADTHPSVQEIESDENRA